MAHQRHPAPIADDSHGGGRAIRGYRRRCTGLALVLVLTLVAGPVAAAPAGSPDGVPAQTGAVRAQPEPPPPPGLPGGFRRDNATPSSGVGTKDAASALAIVNTYRALANLPAVTENTTWSAGDLNHSIYQVKNGFITHFEDPAKPFYTASGDQAGQNGNVYGQWPASAFTDQAAIDAWMTGPFHQVGIIDPRLQTSGYGAFTEAGHQPNIEAAATLDVLRGRTGAWTTPVLFPKHNSTMTLRSYTGNESPDPLTSCAGYAAPTGPPITLQLGSTPSVSAHSFRLNGLEQAHCFFDESTYTNPDPVNDSQATGRAVLASRHAIVIIPRDALVDGTYSVSITSGGNPYSWQFFVGAGGPVADTDADAVVGQASMTTNACGSPSATSLCSPWGAAVAPSGRLYVADTGNNRVLSWPSATSFTNGQAADTVFGQSTVFTGQCNKGQATANQSRLCAPTGVAVDTSGRLYIADHDNNRVVMIATPDPTHTDATLVFGQSDFGGRSCNKAQGAANQSRLCQPTGVAVDPAGNLYVADTGNSRVLFYATPAGGNVDADRVFGQSDYTGTQCNKGQPTTNQSRLCQPLGVGVDPSGNLYVADSSNSRVLFYASPTGGNVDADKVFGQSDYSQSACNKNQPAANQSRLCQPSGVAVDSSGNVYIADMLNSRVLFYTTPATGDVDGDRVYGQSDYASKFCNKGQAGPNQSRLCRPTGVAVDTSGNLIGVDTSNNRVLRYDHP